MKFSILCEKLPNDIPKWVWSERERKVYYTYLYARLRHLVREALGYQNTYILCEEIDNNEDVTKRLIYHTTTNQDIYKISLATFYDGEELEEENDNVELKDFDCNQSARLLTVIKLLLLGKKVAFDILFDDGINKDVAIFMTSETVFLTELERGDDTGEAFFRLYQFKQTYPTLKEVVLIGLLDSSVVSISF